LAAGREKKCSSAQKKDLTTNSDRNIKKRIDGEAKGGNGGRAKGGKKPRTSKHPERDGDRNQKGRNLAGERHNVPTPCWGKKKAAWGKRDRRAGQKKIGENMARRPPSTGPAFAGDVGE